MLKGFLLLFIFLLGTQAAALAQTSPVQLQNLQVELWPEFDRPETLIIFRGELAPAAVLPVQLTFRLPAHIDDFHVVATEQDGVLVEIERETIEWRSDGDERWLTFSTSIPRIHLEYYDPQILTQEGQQRQLRFDFVTPYAVETATFQVQEPVHTAGFLMTPPPTSMFTGSDGLKYHAVEIAGLASGEAFSLSASYQRSTDKLSVELLQSDTAEHAADLPAIAATPPSDNLTLGYVLIGTGVVLLLSVGGYWWWSRQTKQVITRPGPKAGRSIPRPKRQPRSRPTEAIPQPQAKTTSTSVSGFCYRCGTTLRDEADFCHVCGAERRQ